MTKRWGDRKDGKLIRDIDSFHYIMPLIFPNRCDNEAFITERIDLTNIIKYLEKKNASIEDGYQYKFFQLIVTAMLKVCYLRPKMNYFIANGTMYERNEISASFVIRKYFSDHSAEGMAYLRSKPEDNIDTIHSEIQRQIHREREGSGNNTADTMELLTKMPRFLSHALIKFLCFLDKHGWVPQSIINDDPYYSTVLLSNLGSIKLNAAYHHLTNWGTCSVFVTVGEIKKRAFTNEDGSITMKDSIDLGLIIDERLADGYYYSKTIRLLKKLLENPELLEKPLNEEVEY